MGERLKLAAGIVGAVLGFGTMTWLLSWLLQWICSLTIVHHSFSIDQPSVNRLALATVLATVATMALAWVIDELGGCLVILLCVLFWGTVIALIRQWTQPLFAGTAVTTELTQVVYTMVVAAWGYLLYVILNYNEGDDEEEELSDEPSGLG